MSVSLLLLSLKNKNLFCAAFRLSQIFDLAKVGRFSRNTRRKTGKKVHRRVRLDQKEYRKNGLVLLYCNGIRSLQNKENDYNPPCNKIDLRLMYGMAFYYSQINGECIFETKSLGTCLIRE